jgi:hypothetical protein
MDRTESSNPLESRAAIGSYVGLTGVWFVLGIACAILAVIGGPGKGLGLATALSFGPGCAFALWLTGFRLRIAEGVLEYRNGFFRTVRIPLQTIREARYGCEESGPIPWLHRLFIVHSGDAGATEVNPKPFAKNSFQRILEVLQRVAEENALKR